VHYKVFYLLIFISTSMVQVHSTSATRYKLNLCDMCSHC